MDDDQGDDLSAVTKRRGDEVETINALIRQSGTPVQESVSTWARNIGIIAVLIALPITVFSIAYGDWSWAIFGGVIILLAARPILKWITNRG